MAGRGKASGKTLDRKQPETIDGETGKPEPTRGHFGTHGGNGRRIDLANLRDVRLELSYLYRRVDAGEIEASEGSRRAYMLKTIGDIIATAELEQRLLELEERQKSVMQGQHALPLRH